MSNLSQSTRACGRHGASLLRVPLLTPCSRHATHSRVVTLMDQTGAHYFLPYDLTTPFAHFLGFRSAHQALRRCVVLVVRPRCDGLEHKRAEEKRME